MTAAEGKRRRVAAWLWVLFAFVVWNVVFDRLIINATRDYVDAANAAAKASAAPPKIDDAMQPARSRALWLATGSAGVILLVGVAVISAAHPRRT
jgi:hypothetical protein